MTESKLEFTPTYERLPSYLHLAEEALEAELDFISGTEIAKTLGLSSIQVRKDLAFSGLKGIPKRGYKTKEVISTITSFLTWDQNKSAILIGAGNLGRAITLHKEFINCGLEIVAIFDNSKRKIGKKVGDLQILDIKTLDKVYEKVKPDIAIFTLSYKADIQGLADFLSEKGIKGIWNFTKKKILVEQDVAIHNMDFAAGFAVLCADMKRRE